ncbi:MAG: cellobiose phosphorylase [Lachnospirales bacterium]
MQCMVREDFLKKAEALKPRLVQKVRYPKHIVKVQKDDQGKGCVIEQENTEALRRITMGKGETICLDFENHYVGYLTLHISTVGSPPDAPLFMKLKFGENATEITDRAEDYDGWISRSWIQEEYIHVDVFPAVLMLPRRYAMRFLEITVLDTSRKYKIRLDQVSFLSVSAVDASKISSLSYGDALLRRMDQVSIKTLEDCMQDVFEDGPKRDRRLWMGDLRLEAIANYETFRNYELVKRCLYLFAGSRLENGAVGACLFTEPAIQVDDTYMYDYALFYVSVLLDYYEASGDIQTARELWEVAYRQLEIGVQALDEQFLIGEENHAFLDWKAGLNKQAGAQGVLIYCLRCGIRLADLLGYDVSRMEEWLERAVQAAKDYLWDPKQKLFISGKERQISYASQVWMILAQVWDTKTNQELLDRILTLDPEMNMVTPYMNHHFVAACIACGEYERAMQHIRTYWGGMVQEGADTFWELYNPKNKKESPYGSSIINSYCHAWSCTPTYFFRKYEQKWRQQS